jgi:hypothetical protein
MSPGFTAKGAKDAKEQSQNILKLVDSHPALCPMETTFKNPLRPLRPLR